MRGGRIRRNSEPTQTSNLSGLWTLNEIGDYLAEGKWPTIPDAISDLSITGGDTTLDLSWSAPSSKGLPFEYIIEYTPSGGSSVTVITTNTSYQLTNLTNDVEYSVRVGVKVVNRINYSTAVTGTPVSGPVWATLSRFTDNLCGGACDTHLNGSGTEADPFAAAGSADTYWFYRWRGWVIADTSGTIRTYLPNSNYYLFALSGSSEFSTYDPNGPSQSQVIALSLQRGGGTFDVQVQAGQLLKIVEAQFEKGGFDRWWPRTTTATMWTY